MEQKNTKGHGYLRKSKAYGLISGLALGAVAVTTTAVSADETTATIDTQPDVSVVSDSNATNLSDTQADNTEAHDNLAAQAGTQTGNLTEQITSPVLNQAVSDTQNAGVTVNQGQTVTHDSLADAQADLNSQTQTVTDATTAQTTIDSTQNEAIKNAQAAGVTVTQSEGKMYTDPKEALKDNSNQTAHLSEVTNAQKEATQTIADLTKQATASGLDLTKEDTKTYTSVEDVKADLAKQTESIQKAKDTKAAAEATNKANAQSAKEVQNKANQAIKEAIDKAVAAGTKATISGTKETTISEAESLAKEAIEKINQTVAENDRIAKDNAAKQSDYDSRKAALDTKQKADFDKVGLTYTGDYATDKATADAFNKSEVERVNTLFDGVNNSNVLNPTDGWVQYVDANGFTQSGTSQFKKAQSINGVDLVATGSLEPGKATVYIKGDVDQAHIIKSIIWGNVQPEGTNLDGNLGTDWANAYNYNVNGTTSQIWKGKISTWYRIPNAITMLDGSVHDAYVLFHKDNSGLDSPADEVVFWNQDGAINVIDGYRVGVNDKSDAVRTVIRVDSSENDQNYLWISLLGDFDMGQYLQAENNVVTLGVGGGFATNSGVGDNPIGVDENLGGTYGVNHGYNALDGFNSSPDGVALIAQYGREYSTVIRNTPGGNASAVARADFGSEAEVKVIPPRYVEVKGIDKPTPETPLPVSVENVHITPEVVPVPKSASIHDVKLTVDTHDITLSTVVHPVEVTQTPTNSKSVINTDNIDINGKTVAKGSTVKWVLQNNKLLAGREELTAVVMNDPIPAGFEVDEAETARINSTYYTLKALDDGSYQITGTSQLLALLNKDRNQDTPVPSFTIIGKALNDKGHYANTFETIYITASGYYKVVSNTPSYDTPDHPNPTKTVTDKTDTDINGKTSYDKDVTFHLTTDYSPYVNTIVDMETMAKAAGIYDDTDDATVKPDITKATVTDSQGNDITATGTFYDIEAGQPIPQELQIFLDGAHLTPNGEFVVWMPNDLKDYYQNYVLKGNNVTVNLPVAVIGQAGEKAENTFVQIEFSNGYSSNLVFITIPNETAEKHAVDKNGTVLDGQTVPLHQVFNYLLDGVTVTKDHDTLWQYGGKDKLDVEHDRYTGNWKGIIKGTEYTAKEDMTLPYDVTLSDGTLIKAGDTIKAGSTYAFTFELNQDTNDDFINKIVKVTWDAQKGEWTYSIDKHFLNSLGVEGTFDADFWLEVERIKDGEVENTFINTINGREFLAQVTTHTDPEPEAPETPQSPAQVATVQAAALPMTGESNSPLGILASIMGGLLVIFSFMTFRRKEKETNK